MAWVDGEEGRETSEWHREWRGVEGAERENREGGRGSEWRGGREGREKWTDLKDCPGGAAPRSSVTVSNECPELSTAHSNNVVQVSVKVFGCDQLHCIEMYETQYNIRPSLEYGN